jgi:hypothetical protein
MNTRAITKRRYDNGIEGQAKKAKKKELRLVNAERAQTTINFKKILRRGIFLDEQVSDDYDGSMPKDDGPFRALITVSETVPYCEEMPIKGPLDPASQALLAELKLRYSSFAVEIRYPRSKFEFCSTLTATLPSRACVDKHVNGDDVDDKRFVLRHAVSCYRDSLRISFHHHEFINVPDFLTEDRVAIVLAKAYGLDESHWVGTV